MAGSAGYDSEDKDQLKLSLSRSTAQAKLEPINFIVLGNFKLKTNHAYKDNMIFEVLGGAALDLLMSVCLCLLGLMIHVHEIYNH